MKNQGINYQYLDGNNILIGIHGMQEMNGEGMSGCGMQLSCACEIFQPSRRRLFDEP